MKTVFKLHFDCGRMGTLYGLFVEDKEKMDALVESGREVYFGEALGKHSEISGPIQEQDYTLVTSEPSDVDIVVRLGLSFGFNPFEYLEQ